MICLIKKWVLVDHCANCLLDSMNGPSTGLEARRLEDYELGIKLCGLKEVWNSNSYLYTDEYQRPPS